MKKILLGGALIASISAHGIDFKLTCVSAGPASTACNAIKADMEAKAKEDLPDVGLAKYGDGVSNSVSIAGRDNSDYADKFSVVAIKAGLVGVGIDGD